MKKIKIFIGSSIIELKNDRIEIGKLKDFKNCAIMLKKSLTLYYTIDDKTADD